MLQLIFYGIISIIRRMREHMQWVRRIHSRQVHIQGLTRYGLAWYLSQGNIQGVYRYGLAWYLYQGNIQGFYKYGLAWYLSQGNKQGFKTSMVWHGTCLKVIYKVSKQVWFGMVPVSR